MGPVGGLAYHPHLKKGGHPPVRWRGSGTGGVGAPPKLAGVEGRTRKSPRRDDRQEVGQGAGAGHDAFRRPGGGVWSGPGLGVGAEGGPPLPPEERRRSHQTGVSSPGRGVPESRDGWCSPVRFRSMGATGAGDEEQEGPPLPGPAVPELKGAGVVGLPPTGEPGGRRRPRRRCPGGTSISIRCCPAGSSPWNQASFSSMAVE